MHASIRALLLSSALAAAAHAQSTERVSVDSAGAQAHSTSNLAGIAASGRYVVFSSIAGNLTSPDTNALEDVFIKDRQTGQTTRVSVGYAGDEPNGHSISNSISPDGRLVAFWSGADNLVPTDTNHKYDVFVRDLQTGQTTRASVDSNEVEANGDSKDPVVSADGRFVVYSSVASNLILGDTNLKEDIFVHDRVTAVTARASITWNGAQSFADSYSPSISADGRYVCFVSEGGFFVPNDTNQAADVFVHDRNTGATQRVSVSSMGAQGNAASQQASLSANGRYVAFATSATDLVAISGGPKQVLVHDLLSGETTLASRTAGGAPANANCGLPSISDDGRFVSFTSPATNLDPNDTYAASGVFVHDRVLGEIAVVSIPCNNDPFTYGCYSQAISSDGRSVVFISQDANLVAGDTNAAYDVFVRALPPHLITGFCFGDGSSVNCPCGNNGSHGSGCANSHFPLGAHLTGTGNPSITTDSVILLGQQMTGNVCVFFQGTQPISPVVIDDGLGCVSGSIIRLGTKSVVNAAAQFPDAGDPLVSIKGAIGAIGGSHYYQLFYRDAAALFCPPATTNRTNGIVITWSP